MENWFVKIPDYGPNIMIVPPAKYIEVVQQRHEQPMRILFISQDLGE